MYYSSSKLTVTWILNNGYNVLLSLKSGSNNIFLSIFILIYRLTLILTPQPVYFSDYIHKLSTALSAIALLPLSSNISILPISVSLTP